MSFLTGKRAKNRAFEWLQQAQGPAMGQQMQLGSELQDQGRAFLNAYQGGLGLGGADAFNEGFRRFQTGTGFRTIQNEAMRGLTNSLAARGVMGSGAALRAMQDRSANLAQQSYQNYLGQVLGGAQMGFQAGQGAYGNAANFGNTIAGAGQTGGSQGLFGAIGQGIGGAASLFKSDRRAKEDIKQIGTRPDGLGVYEYTLKDTGQRQIGVMADEVAALRPEALGPVVDGYQTVRYGLL
jgi:hypothetical protein